MCDASLTLKFQFDLRWAGSDSKVDERLYELYEAMLRKYKLQGVRLVEHVYEKDGNGKLHLHAHIRLSKLYANPAGEPWQNRYDLFKQKGFSIKVDKIGSLPGWKKYMLKDAQVKGKYFKYGTSLSSSAEKTMCENASTTYKQCILNEIESLADLDI